LDWLDLVSEEKWPGFQIKMNTKFHHYAVFSLGVSILAENCRTPKFTERLLWKRQTPKFNESAAKSDPKLALSIQAYSEWGN
jgi:hypothetical protein